ncbi:hypothetical protein F8388_005877, partial [Cannabis sativa]
VMGVAIGRWGSGICVAHSQTMLYENQWRNPYSHVIKVISSGKVGDSRANYGELM